MGLGTIFFSFVCCVCVCVFLKVVIQVLEDKDGYILYWSALHPHNDSLNLG